MERSERGRQLNRPTEEASTTPTTANKRAAGSPVEENLPKKAREVQNNAWQKVQSKKTSKPKRQAEEISANTPGKERTAPSHSKQKRRRKRKRKPTIKRTALIIKPAEGNSYADVLREIRSKATPEESETEVRGIRQTKTGDVLVELGEKTKDKAAFSDVLKKILEGKAVVRSLEPKETLEIRDLDGLTTKEEVEEAITRDLKELAGDIQVSVTKANSQELKTAIVQINTNGAKQLLRAQFIKIGWVRCRVRPRIVVPRCFKCLGYGHVARTCKGPDRSRACYKCGGADHKGKECTNAERCFLCTEKDVESAELKHAAGSGRCRVFRDELERARKQQ